MRYVAAQVAEPLRCDWPHVGLVGHWLGGGGLGEGTPGCCDNGQEGRESKQMEVKEKSINVLMTAAGEKLF